MKSSLCNKRRKLIDDLTSNIVVSTILFLKSILPNLKYLTDYKMRGKWCMESTLKGIKCHDRLWKLLCINQLGLGKGLFARVVVNWQWIKIRGDNFYNFSVFVLGSGGGGSSVPLEHILMWYWAGYLRN